MFTYIFRTFILSFSIFWRMVLVIPVYITFATCFAFGALFVPMSGLMIAAVAGLTALAILAMTAIMTIAFTMISVIANIIAIRAGLSARDAWGPPDFIRLLKVGFQYSVFHTFVALFVLGLAGGALIVLHLSGVVVGMAELNKINPNDPVSLSSLHPAVLVIVGLAVLILYVIMAAMQTPLAAAAHGVNMKAHQPDFFYGFGDRFVIQFIIVVVTNTALMVLQVYNLIAAIPIVLYATIAGDGVPPEVRVAFGSMETVLAVGGLLLFGIWLISLLNAAATQSYLDLAGRRAAAAAEVVVAQRIDPDTLRDLRQSRMR
jgi:hypothetical protein